MNNKPINAYTLAYIAEEHVWIFSLNKYLPTRNKC